MAKVKTFNGSSFWKKAYAHERSKLLQLVHVPNDQLVKYVNKGYAELPAPLRYEIETSGITLKNIG
tara:strand:+ start:1429 stop:1626 length:198 start_codon:yes stop_codon:yes gene_type:complete